MVRKVISLEVTADVDMHQSWADVDTEHRHKTTCRSKVHLNVELENGRKIVKELPVCKNEVDDYGGLRVIPENQLHFKIEGSDIKAASVDVDVCSEGPQEVIFVSLENLRTITRVCLNQ